MKKKVRMIGMIIGSLLLICFVAIGYYKLYMDPARGCVGSLKESLILEEVLTKKEAGEDLDYIMDQLEKFHPAWKELQSEAAQRVTAQYLTEKENLEEGVTALELWQAASRMIQALGDAHTRVSTSRLGEQLGYEIKWEILSINGEPINEIYQRFLALWPYELESYAKTRFDKFIIYDEYMQLAGVDTSCGIDVVYQLDQDKISEHLEAVPYEEEKKDFVSYEIDNKHHMGLFTLNACKNDPAYDKALAAFFKEVADAKAQTVVVDLRENNGGWIPNIKDFLKYIEVDQYQYCNQLWTRLGPTWYKEKEQIENQKVEEPFKGQLYVLTGPKTFSAAMDFAMVLQDNGLGKIVGEVPGNMPDSYTINQKYQLPHSKLKLVVSGAKQSRIDETKKGEPLQPDYEVPSDEALEKVYELAR